MMELAVGAAYTYLLYYPEHETMKNNVQYYRTMDNVQESYFKDLHAKKYQVGPLYEINLCKEFLPVIQQQSFLTTKCS